MTFFRRIAKSFEQLKVCLEMKMTIDKFCVLVIIFCLNLVVGTQRNDEECNEQLLAFADAIVAKELWASKR